VNQNSLPKLLNSLGMLLLALYGVLVLFDTLPIKLLQPDWIFNLAVVLGNYVSIPLVGMVLVQLAAYLSPDHLAKVQVRVARLSAILALIFLLLQPMLGFAVWRNFRTLSIFNKEQVELINRKSKEITQAINKAGSFSELQTKMIMLQGPVVPEQARSMDLPVLKKQLVDVIKAARDSAPGRLTTPTSAAYIDFYKRLARTSVVCLLALLGFGLLSWNQVSSQNILLSYLTSIGLFGITPNSIYTGFTSFYKNYQIKRTEDANVKSMRHSAAMHQRQIRKAEAELKRQQIADRKQAERSRMERERMLEVERKMERKRQLEEERQRRGE
jgi:hypothetical protein